MTFKFDPATGVDLYGPDGEVIWSSSRKQAYWTNYINGSFTIAAMPGFNAAGVIQSVVQNVKPVAANATHVMGSFTATQSGGYTVGGVANGGIHQLGGTTLLMCSTYNMYPSLYGSDEQFKTWGTGSEDVAGAILLSTYIEGGWFKAHIERYKPTAGDLPSSWSGIGFYEITIAYQGVAYTFDN